MANFSRIKGEESSTTTFKAATVIQTRNSSNMHQELISLADAESSLGIARVLASAPVSTEYGLAVRIVSGPSSAVDLAVRTVFSSTATDNQVAITAIGAQYFSSAVAPSDTQGFKVRVIGGASSGADFPVFVSSLAGAVIMRSSKADALVSVYQSTASDLQATVTPVAGSTWNVRPFQSSAADLKVSAFLFDSTGNAIDASTQSMSSGARGIFVRPVIPGSTTYAASTAGQSTLTALFSSAAATRPYVYAYSITSTNTTPVDCAFCISSGANAGSTIWIVRLQSNSSGVTGANMAVAPPGYLFRGSTGQNMTFNVTSSVVGGISLSVAAFRSS